MVLKIEIRFPPYFIFLTYYICPLSSQYKHLTLHNGQYNVVV